VTCRRPAGALHASPRMGAERSAPIFHFPLRPRLCGNSPALLARVMTDLVNDRRPRPRPAPLRGKCRRWIRSPFQHLSPTRSRRRCAPFVVRSWASSSGTRSVSGSARSEGLPSCSRTQVRSSDARGRQFGTGTTSGERCSSGLAGSSPGFAERRSPDTARPPTRPAQALCQVCYGAGRSRPFSSNMTFEWLMSSRHHVGQPWRYAPPGFSQADGDSRRAVEMAQSHSPPTA